MYTSAANSSLAYCVAIAQDETIFKGSARRMAMTSRRVHREFEEARAYSFRFFSSRRIFKRQSLHTNSIITTSAENIDATRAQKLSASKGITSFPDQKIQGRCTRLANTAIQHIKLNSTYSLTTTKHK